MYEASVAVHVAAAVVGFGATFSYPVIQTLAERRHPRALAFAHAAILAISRYVAVPAATLVGITGVYQVADGLGTVNALLAAASIAVATVVIGYEPIDSGAVVLADCARGSADRLSDLGDAGEKAAALTSAAGADIRADGSVRPSADHRDAAKVVMPPKAADFAASGACRARTGDPQLAKLVLSQLS